MNPLQNIVTTRKPMMRTYVGGIEGCLMEKDNEELRPLLLLFEPLSLELILSTKEVSTLIEQVEMYSEDEKTKAIATAAKDTLKMKNKDKLQMVKDVLTVGKKLFIDYVKLGGWLSRDELANAKDWTQHPNVFPVRMVATEAEALEKTEAAKIDPDVNVREIAYIPVTFLTEDELLDMVGIVKEIASQLKKSDEPIIPIKTAEGGESGVSPKDMNAFPRSI